MAYAGAVDLIEHLFELYNVGVYKSLVIKDFSLHIFRHLCGTQTITPEQLGPSRVVHDPP